MFIADAHCDVLYAIAVEGRQPCMCAVTKDALCSGGVGLQTFALFSGAERRIGIPRENALRMLASLPLLGVPIVEEKLPEHPPESTMGILSCEGAEMFEGSLKRFEDLHARAHFKMIALTWNYENELGYPAVEGSPQGLKPFGRTMLNAMDQKGILADVSHLNEAGFWEVFERAELPPVASHSNCRWLCDASRNLSRRQARALIERKGFIGINFYSRFLREEGTAHLEDVMRHIDALCEMGGEDVVGFGSDFDGIDAWPEEISGPGAFPELLQAMEKRGYTRLQMEKIAGLNLWRVLKEAEGAQQAWAMSEA